MLKIVFSTTCQWNPGDEFILHGIRNLLASSGIEFNTVLYNRNPITNPKFGYCNLPDFHENSLVPKGPFRADYAIFAGTPEWCRGPRAERFIKYVHTHRIRCSFLGVGSSRRQRPGRLLQQILQHQTDVFLARDETAREAVLPYFPAAAVTACPSIFAGPRFQPPTQLRRIGCVLQGTRVRSQRIPCATQVQLYKQYRKLADRFDIGYVAHFIDDLNDPSPTDHPTYYSGIAADYYDIYRRFDLIVSSRLHACGAATSLGIPSICLGHDARIAAARHMGAQPIHSAEDIPLVVEGIDWWSITTRLQEIRTAALGEYQRAFAAMRLLNRKS